MAYGDFPIFTRRYAFHGLENFAFDLLLGKPCLIVAHHDSFKDGGAALVEFIEKLESLNCCLRWRPLGQVVRRVCRHRSSGPGAEEMEMYGNELVVSNGSDQPMDVRIRKRKNKNDLILEILCDEKPCLWTTEAEHIVFGERIASHCETRFLVVYQEQAHNGTVHRSLGFELSVAVRRMLSEFRDDYWFRSGFLKDSADRLKSAFRKVI